MYLVRDCNIVFSNNLIIIFSDQTTCIFKDMVHGTGEKFFDGCDFECTCKHGEIECEVSSKY